MAKKLLNNEGEYEYLDGRETGQGIMSVPVMSSMIGFCSTVGSIITFEWLRNKVAKIIDKKVS